MHTVAILLLSLIYVVFIYYYYFPEHFFIEILSVASFAYNVMDQRGVPPLDFYKSDLRHKNLKYILQIHLHFPVAAAGDLRIRTYASLCIHA